MDKVIKVSDYDASVDEDGKLTLWDSSDFVSLTRADVELMLKMFADVKAPPSHGDGCTCTATTTHKVEDESLLRTCVKRGWNYPMATENVLVERWMKKGGE